MIELQIAASAIRGQIPKEGPLEDRIKAAMLAIRKAPESEVFWMSSKAPDDDMKFRTALAAVMLEGSDDDREMITRSLKPLKALSAMMQGIPVDFEAVMADTENTIPLMKLWHATKEQGR